MVRVLGLPVTDADASVSRAPRADVLRAQLGGRAQTPVGAGELVTLETSSVVSLVGVLLGESGDQRLVLTRGGVVRKADKARVQRLPEPAAQSHATGTSHGDDSELRALAARVKRFAALDEGDNVCIEDARLGSVEGILVEKCRFGGLVLRKDGSLLAAGFSKLQPQVFESSDSGNTGRPSQ
ncbi:MAG: hypothetical protein KC492_24020 [Myxococcales bacterium]|nr:hypothetical protein [Myxococcales bacterium]